MKLARKLNAFDATLIVAGGIVGAGIFRNPSVVAQRVHTTPLVLAVWIFGGILALVGGFIFAELAWRRPASGGLYGYMRDAFHPSVAFMYGWTALWVSQSGGMAAAAVTFAAYVVPFFGNGVAPWIPAAGIIAVLSAINCFGVREGGTTQNLLMLLKIGVIAALIVGGIVAIPVAHHASLVPSPNFGAAAVLSMFGAALVPVLYAYDGWQTAPFMDGELKDTRRTLPLGLIIGVAIVIVLYLAVTLVSVRVLGASGLAATDTPASDLMRVAFGPLGERIIAIGVALSTLGFISNQVLTSPRIYYVMAKDGIFFKSLSWVHPKTRVPLVAIIAQALVAIGIAAWGKYDQILNYVTAMDFIFLGLAGVALFIFVSRSGVPEKESGVRVPLHPWSTIFFILVSAAVVINTYVTFPKESLIGLGILLSGVPAYWIWRTLCSQSRFIPAG